VCRSSSTVSNLKGPLEETLSHERLSRATDLGDINNLGSVRKTY